VLHKTRRRIGNPSYSTGCWRLSSVAYYAEAKRRKSDSRPFKLNDADDVTLENYHDNNHGFMRVQVTDGLITGEYYAVDVNLVNQHPNTQARLIDSFELDYEKHKLNRSAIVP
jgi:hypothetical protein